MKRIPLTAIYDEINDYYGETAVADLIEAELDCEENETIIQLSDEEILFIQNQAFRTDESGDQWETSRETICRYIKSYFVFLVKNVFYLDPNQFKEKGQYYVDEADYPVLKEVLLRSVSHHERDRIIGRWLRGKIADDAFHELGELSDRLIEIINDLNDVVSDTKKRWISALKIALHTEYAYALRDVESTLLLLFKSTLPFHVENTINNLSQHDSQEKSLEPDPYYFEHKTADQNTLRCAIIDFIDTLGKAACDNIPSRIYEFLKNFNFDTAIGGSLPPLELLKLKSVCQYLKAHPWMKSIIPHSNKVDEFSDYFALIDKEIQEQQQQRKKKDQKRYQCKTSRKQHQ